MLNPFIPVEVKPYTQLELDSTIGKNTFLNVVVKTFKCNGANPQHSGGSSSQATSYKIHEKKNLFNFNNLF